MSRKGFLQNAKNICTRFPEMEIEQIDEHAEKEGTTRSGLIRSVVSRFLPHKNREPAEPTAPWDHEPEETVDNPSTEVENRY